MTISADLLHDALEGRASAGPAQGELAGLVRIVRRARSLHVVGPSPDVAARMGADFARLIDQPRRPRLVAWLIAWTPLSPRPRPLAVRLAAGAVLLAGAATSVTTVGGDGPVDAVAGIAHFAVNAVANLLPRDDSSGMLQPLVATPAPSAQASTAGDATTATPEPTQTPTPSPTPPVRPAAAAPPVNTPVATPAPNDASVAPGTPEPSATTVPTVPPVPSPSPSPAVSPTTTPTLLPPVGTPTPPPSPSVTSTPKPSPSATPTPGGDEHEDEEKETKTPEPTQTPEVERR